VEHHTLNACFESYYVFVCVFIIGSLIALFNAYLLPTALLAGGINQQ